MAVSGFFQHYWWALLLIVLVILIARLLLRCAASRAACSLPPAAPGARPSAACQMNAASPVRLHHGHHAHGGPARHRALEVTSGVVSNYLFADAVRRVRQGVEQGRALADCMLTDPAFPRLLTEMTGVGERSGNLEQTLTVIGDYFDNEVSVTTRRLLSLLEPAITIALAVITVILLLAVYLPMFTMYGSLI